MGLTLKDILEIKDLDQFSLELHDCMNSSPGKKNILMLRQFIENSLCDNTLVGLLALDIGIECQALERDLQNLGQLLLDKIDGGLFDSEILFGLSNLLISYRQEFKPNFIRKVIQKGLRVVLSQNLATHTISNYMKLLKEFPKATALESCSILDILISQIGNSEIAISILALMNYLSPSAKVFRKICHTLIVINDHCTGDQGPLSEVAMQDRFPIALCQESPKSPAVKYFNDYEKYITVLEIIIKEGNVELEIELIFDLLECYLDGFCTRFALAPERFLWTKWLNKILIAFIVSNQFGISEFRNRIGQVVEKSIKFSLENKLKIRFESPQQGLLSSLNAAAICVSGNSVPESVSRFVSEVLYEELQISFEKYHDPYNADDRYDETLKLYILNLCQGKNDKFAELMLKFIIRQDLRIRGLIKSEQLNINNEHELFESAMESMGRLFILVSPEMQKASASYIETIFSGIEYKVSWKLSKLISTFFLNLDKFAHPRLPAIKYLHMNYLDKNGYQDTVYVREVESQPIAKPAILRDYVEIPEKSDTTIKVPSNSPPSIPIERTIQNETQSTSMEIEKPISSRFFNSSSVPEKRLSSEEVIELELPNREIKRAKESSINDESVAEIEEDCDLNSEDDRISFPDIVVDESE